jgi:hypothetical protein
MSDLMPTLPRRALVVAVLLVGAGGLLAACSDSGGGQGSSASTSSTGGNTRSGSSTPVSAAPDAATPGDIPDTVAYIAYSNAAGGYTFVHPEGWAQSGQGTAVSFTDHYNMINANVAAGASPTVPSARAVDVPALRTSQPAFELLGVAPVTLPAGSGVLITYKRNSPPDPVTNRSVRQLVQRYEINGPHHVVILELSGAVGADNVDPYTKVSQSLRIS